MRYTDKATMLSLFSPDRQSRYTTDLRRAYMGGAPTMQVADQAFGAGTAEAWLKIAIFDLAEYTGCRAKQTDRQTAQVASAIRSNFGYLKLTELMHFFLLFKSGTFGTFYGSVDGMVITNALHQYLRIRAEKLQHFGEELAEERRQRQREADSQVTLSYEEWQCLYWYWNMGYEPWRIRQELAEERRQRQNTR